MSAIAADIEAAIEMTAALMRGALTRDGEARDMVLRVSMDARHSRLLQLSGGTAGYLGASLALLACAPIAGWWIAIPCVPLSLLGAADGRAWRDLKRQWAPPIVVPTRPSVLP